MTVRVGFKTSPQGVDWQTLDETWALAGELGVFSSGWLNDHLTDTDPDRPGPSFEGLTLLATLVHRVPGKEVGHAVLSNTFRHPVLVAKAATALDHATGGRFLLGLGAGWFEGEHVPFGIPLPPIGGVQPSDPVSVNFGAFDRRRPGSWNRAGVMALPLAPIGEPSRGLVRKSTVVRGT